MTEKAAQTRLVKPLRSGQITIPVEFRREMGIDENSLIEISMSGGGLHLYPVSVRSNQGSSWLKELYDHFAPVRQDILERGISEEEVNADIDAALAAVRAERRKRDK